MTYRFDGEQTSSHLCEKCGQFGRVKYSAVLKAWLCWPCFLNRRRL